MKTSRNTDMGKMDPYLKITLGNETVKTKVYSGQEVTFEDEEFTFKFTEPIADFKVVVMDDDTFSDDYVAQTVVPLMDTVQSGEATEKCDLSYQGESVGEIVFEMRFG